MITNHIEDDTKPKPGAILDSTVSDKRNLSRI
jgi:hypothetical protein